MTAYNRDGVLVTLDDISPFDEYVPLDAPEPFSLPVAPTPQQANVFADFLSRYRLNVALFIEEVLGWTPYGWQLAVCRDYDNGERRITIRSGHGVGKGWLLAALALHHLLCRFPQKTVCTAPTSSQLFDALWNDIKAFANKLPPLILGLIEVKAERIELRQAPQQSFVSARTSRAEQPEAMQGIRSDGWTLILGDEASGIPEQVFEAGAGSMSGERASTILTGNPLYNSGFFYRTHTSLASMWKVHHVSCLDVPHISADFIEDMAQRYGRDSAKFAYRVLGEFPKSDENTIIATELVDSAINREVATLPTLPVVWGLDCARGGGDLSALAKRRHNRLLEKVRTFSYPDLMQVVADVVSDYNTTPADDRPVEICVDAIGLGAGVADRLRQIFAVEAPTCMIRSVNVSEAPAVNNHYLNLRADLWYTARDWFYARDVCIPADPLLRDELISLRRGRPTNTGKATVESKDAMKDRGLASPNAADAFVLTFAATAAQIYGGWANNTFDAGSSIPLPALGYV